MDNKRSKQTLPLGIRNNNPGNIRSNPYNLNYWKKQSGSRNGFCVFPSMYYGVRALCRLLLTYYKRGWLINAFVFASHYAPESDHNNTKKYAEYVSSSWFNGMFSPHHLAVSIMEMENGCDYVTDVMIKYARWWSFHFFAPYFNNVPNNSQFPVCVKESAY